MNQKECDERAKARGKLVVGLEKDSPLYTLISGTHLIGWIDGVEYHKSNTPSGSLLSVLKAASRHNGSAKDRRRIRRDIRILISRMESTT